MSTGGNSTTGQEQIDSQHGTNIRCPPLAYNPAWPAQRDIEANFPPRYDRVADGRATYTDDVPLQDLGPVDRRSPLTRFAADDDATLFEYAPKPKKFTMFDQGTTKKGFAYVLIVFFVISGVLTVIGLVPLMVSERHAKNAKGG
ncbi:hypothetical protein V1525DRAFT_386583 [Lipomyces kononenkoae]|uniref:Uncharacterized protein n=1 Tax=Lipomyces kononenkoae TaxID=34357 RepID=A0ACC3T7B9_LIPKO